MNHPSVTVLMPVYNGEAHLKYALDSLLSQDFSDFELIINDNKSTDNQGQHRLLAQDHGACEHRWHQ